MLCTEAPRILCVVANIREQQKAWIGSILAMTEWTPTELARRSRVNQTTLTRFLNDPQEKATLSSRTIAMISEATGWDAYVQPENDTRRLPATIGDVESLPSGDQVLRADIEAALHGIIGSRNAAFARLVKTRALETAGYLPRDIIVIDQNEPPRRGDVVVATQDLSRDAGGPSRAESLLRIYEPPFLVTATHDPASRKPLFVDDETVVIMGVVIGMVRPRLAA